MLIEWLVNTELKEHFKKNIETNYQGYCLIV